MRTQKFIPLFLIFMIAFSSCEKRYKFKLTTSQKVVLNSKASVTLTEENNNAIDSLHFYVNNKRIAANGKSFSLNTANYGVGKHVVTALVFYHGITKKINNSIEVVSNMPYAIYDFKIKNSYPHDKTAYTQGLEYHNGFLYESTGKKGKSSIRKVELKTGKVLQKIAIDKQYFGEGMTILDDKIYFLTWKSGKGFVYDLNTFEELEQFSYSRSFEGWGITNNGNELIKSDGTEKIWFLDPTTKKEKRSISIYTDKNGIKDLNELEFINGKIYANYWKQPLIAIINPENGIVEGIVNLTRLQNQMKKEEKLTHEDEVLNGIAYDSKNNRLFVTGKHWGKLFEIELVKK